MKGKEEFRRSQISFSPLPIPSGTLSLFLPFLSFTPQRHHHLFIYLLEVKFLDFLPLGHNDAQPWYLFSTRIFFPFQFHGFEPSAGFGNEYRFGRLQPFFWTNQLRYKALLEVILWWRFVLLKISFSQNQFWGFLSCLILIICLISNIFEFWI